MDADKITILVLEDDDFQREMLVKMLGTLGVKYIFEATNGTQALTILAAEKNNSIDIALCDINMPEMDGMEFMRHLGAQHSATPIVILSTLDTALLASVAQMSLAYGINLLEVIEKPISLARLKQLLLQLSGPEKNH